MVTTIAEICAVLSTTATRWSQLVERIPDDLLRQRPAPGEWSPLECLQHIVDTERIFAQRVTALRLGQDIPAFDPSQEGSQESCEPWPVALAATFARLRAENLVVLSHVRADELGRGGVHSELGRVTLGQLLHEWAAHDLNHTIQAERALMQPFINGCGPWQPYFAAHHIRDV
jgi:uncharacterized damage-inducible protein DinB